MGNKLKLILIEVIPAFLIFLFVYTAISKIITHDTFATNLNKSPLLLGISVPLAWAIPLFELFIAALLFIPRYRKLGLLFSALLMSLLTLYVLYMLLSVTKLPCSCGGVINQLGWKGHLFLNICLTLIAFAGWQLTRSNKTFIAINRSSRIPV